MSRRSWRAIALALGLCGAPWGLAHADVASPPHVHVVSFALWGRNPLFKREAVAAADVIAAHYGHSGQVIVRANSPARSAARIPSIRSTLEGLASAIDTDNDVVVVFLTSHGGKEGLAINTTDSRRIPMLSPGELIGMLTANRIRNKVIIVSACYSGVFADLLADADTLVITAADADHSSFGCSDDNTGDYTWFGQALFGETFKPGVDLGDAFRAAKVRIAEREAAAHFEGSNPQMQGGSAVLAKLSKLK